MKFIEKIALWLVPRWQLIGTGWEIAWDQSERLKFAVAARASCFLAAVLYFFHIALDRSAGIEPAGLFLTYRISIGTSALLLGLAYNLKTFKENKFQKIPFLLLLSTCAILQAASMTWSSIPIPYIFFILMDFAFALVARLSPALTIAFYGAIWTIQYSLVGELVSTDVAFWSMSVVGFSLAVFLRSLQIIEIRAFLADRELVKSQQALIETQRELSDQVRAFLPKEIFARISHFQRSNKTGVIQAVDTVLRTQPKIIACLFSDVRGFTAASRDLMGYVEKEFVEQVRAATKAVEAQHGIPRIIGDLIFTYFDDDVEHLNVLRATRAALALRDIATRSNDTHASATDRFCIVSTGIAIVGNIGGLDSSREITALGPPVNLASRIDPLTKAEAFKKDVGSHRILLTSHAAKSLKQVIGDIALVPISLGNLQLTIRDFPEETTIYALPESDSNKNIIFSIGDEHEDALEQNHFSDERELKYG